MVEKILSIGGIGKFTNYVGVGNSVGDISFLPITIIYAENGQGKTTLSQILYSLKSNDYKRLLGRRSFNSPTLSTPTVKIKSDKGVHTLSQIGWDASYNDIEVFDAFFTDENVYTGMQQTGDHKKNICNFAIGSASVKLAKDISDLRAERITKSGIKSTIEKQLSVRLKGQYTLDQFLQLKEDQDIEGKIIDFGKRIKRSEESLELKKKSELEAISIDKFLQENLIKEVLETTIEEITENSKMLVQEHFAHIQSHDPAKWIEEGVESMRDHRCPFCNQDISDSNELVSAYSKYFNTSYSTLHTKLSLSLGWLNSLRVSYGSLNSVKKQNELLFESWEKYVTFEHQLPLLELPFNTSEFMENVDALIDELEKKRKDLSNITSDFTAITEFSEKIEALHDLVVKYNSRVETVNTEIKKIKVQPSENIEELKQQKTKAEVLSARYSEEVKTQVTELTAVTSDIDSLSKQIEQKTAELKQLSQDVLQKYGAKINEVLSFFTTEFKLDSFDALEYSGKSVTPKANFQIKNSYGIAISTSEDPEKSSFKNTFSEGDKNALSFSFFLAKLLIDPKLDEKIVVFDDPITSFDVNRRSSTIERIRSLIDKCKQVIVLTHDLGFAWEMWEKCEAGKKKAMHITRNGTTNILEAWDIETAKLEPYFVNYDTLDNFRKQGGGRTQGELLTVTRCIRPVLEHYYRVKYRKFGRSQWLGDMLKEFKEHPDIYPAMVKAIPLLEIVNDFSKPYHHSDNGYQNTQVSETELTNSVNKVFELLAM